ncbi:hypothetical protein TNCV_1645291 [Trichonephila clavipes]|nr:hypothetical protein TNCV_1645291 [Trichonephila clavipes]
MTQRTAPWDNWHLERDFELLRTFGLVGWGLGGSGHVEECITIIFKCRKPLPYNCDSEMFELKMTLSSAHNTRPGPDEISYELLRHLNKDSLASLYVDDLQISSSTSLKYYPTPYGERIESRYSECAKH